MFSQIADCAQSKPLCFTAAHHKGVRIVKPERLRHADAESCKRIANLIER